MREKCQKIIVYNKNVEVSSGLGSEINDGSAFRSNKSILNPALPPNHWLVGFKNAEFSFWGGRFDLPKNFAKCAEACKKKCSLLRFKTVFFQNRRCAADFVYALHCRAGPAFARLCNLI